MGEATTAKVKLSDKVVKGVEAPATGSRIVWDTEIAGFGVRVTAGKVSAFILNYRTSGGRQRRYTIGRVSDWSVTAARKHAAELRARIDLGDDPLGEIEEERGAATIKALCDRFERDYMPKLRPASQKLYGGIINGPKAHPKRGKPRKAFEGIRRAWGSRKVAEIGFADVEQLHHRVSRTAPITANRLVSVRSRLFSLSIRWKWRSDNPAKGIERNHEEPRQRYLSTEELGRLMGVLADFPDQQAADIVRLLLLTGARSGETYRMRWDQLDLAGGVWTKPASTTKAKRTHRVPLSAPARQILAALPRSSEWVFPGDTEAGHRASIESAWARIAAAAELDGVRIHDLRHSHASILASAGLSLPVIGALLGHSQPATTARYAHLMDDPLWAATERVAAVVAGGGKDNNVVALQGSGTTHS